MDVEKWRLSPQCKYLKLVGYLSHIRIVFVCMDCGPMVIYIFLLCVLCMPLLLGKFEKPMACCDTLLLNLHGIVTAIVVVVAATTCGRFWKHYGIATVMT